MSDAHYWSDGTPVTANDVVFTFETVRALELGGSWADVFPDSIKSIHADTPTDLRIEFTQRPSLVVWPNLVGLAPIMPSHVWAGQVEDITVEDLYSLSGSEDVGGGPLALLQVTDELIVSVANPGYPGGIGPEYCRIPHFCQRRGCIGGLESRGSRHDSQPQRTVSSPGETAIKRSVTHSQCKSVEWCQISRFQPDSRADE